MEQSINIQKAKSLLKAILLTGLLVGILDAIAASVAGYFPRGITPDRVFRFVASGVFGKDAFTGGTPMALLGLLFHFIIAYGWSLLFFLAYPKVNLLTKNKIIVGLVYGIFVLLAMNLIVVPLSNVPNAKPGNIHLPQVIIHMFLVGLPISLMANRYYSNK